MSTPFIGKLNTIKKLSERDGKAVLEIESNEGINVLTNLNFGHRSSVKSIKEQDFKKWFPCVEVNGQLVFIQDEEVSEGLKFFRTRYLALNFARRYLAQQHKKKPLNHSQEYESNNINSSVT